jgi:1-acyl-sn-glycerol-3-phosphate acyltransferase
MQLFGRFLLSVWGFIWGSFWTWFCSTLYFIPAIFVVHPRWMDFCQKLHSKGLLGALAVRVRIVGSENYPEGTTAIVMANHRSLLDIPVMVSQVPHIRFVAKKELGRIPFFGWALWRSEHVLIDRMNRAHAITALQEMAGVFGKGRNLMVFPEGTRARTAKLLPFKKGGFHLAVDTGLPILPVSIEGMQRVLPKGRVLIMPGVVTVVVHPLVPVEGLGKREIPELMRRVRATMLSALPDARALEEEAAAPKEVGGGASAGTGAEGNPLTSGPAAS